MYTNQQMIDVASHFKYGASPESFQELTAGNINATFRLDFPKTSGVGSCILQRINTNAFHDPEALMRNVRLVTEHIRSALAAQGLDSNRRVLSFVEAENGTLLYRDAQGGAWRSYHFVDNCTAYNQVESPALFCEIGRGFGEFQRRLSDFPAGELVETIPHFHDTPLRYQALLNAVAADPVGRVKGLKKELDFLSQRSDMMHSIVDRLATGELPLRVTHNDTKVNNVLLDNTTHQALCVIDLDTVMPGSSLYDFGDAVRFGACTAAEDEPDTDKIGFDMELFHAFAKGFVGVTAGSLTETEISMLPVGVSVLTCELAVRFLSDYIDGDRYFKIHYPEHNLVRARAQMKLLTEVERHRDDMNACIQQILQEQ
jgi:Ser/Thr protein kinase RdoA (MazF antagonist)